MQKDGVHETIKTSKPTKQVKGRVTIALSPKSVAILDELKDYTEAETTTEVFRDSLRLAYTIMNAQKNGLRVEVTNPADPNARPSIIGVGNEIPG
ncbi:ribbon-helix-helix protein, CopG family [Leisingera sp. JC1]|uniref:ribbon-helix-helix protein, CopG family n=1 Tax=Leisingera sp. JC1 TaxID=1855282 RepID=UPI000807B9F3|nr:ribbon-helix-helix protein, CopG family [Leisingera sp. JC1]OBY26729.1 hypothetical protein A9D60_17880 [Leisingera sp. JC1]